jgi:hypothetical protein
MNSHAAQIETIAGVFPPDLTDPPFEVGDIFREYGPGYRARHKLTPEQHKALTAIAACRTKELGGHIDECDHCGHRQNSYNSCRNRNCPKCQSMATAAWVDARLGELLPVPYFHLVFTLPHDLHGLVGQCPRVIYELLFGAVAATLIEFAANPRWLGGTPAFSLVLHTWKQDLERHVHIHALMAGGALTATGEWTTAKRGFLFPVCALSKVFRGKFVTALKAARDSGKLDGAWSLDKGPWRALLARLHAHEWVVYAKQPLGGPAQVLEYLGRYTHRVAIANERIVAVDDGEVRFRVRDSAAGNRKRVLRLPAATFIDRFLLHVLPHGFKRIRHYGLLGPAAKTVKLAQARAALAVPAPDPVVVEAVACEPLSGHNSLPSGTYQGIFEV